jgi:DNA repair protein RadC
MKVAEIKVTYISKNGSEEPVIIKSSADGERCFRENWSESMEHIEEMYLMLLNRANRVLGISKISMGGVNATVVDPKVVFQTALKANASSMILAHNHPSGSVKPSENDIRLTRKLREGALILDIALLDHLIVSHEGYFSFADEGLL